MDRRAPPSEGRDLSPVGPRAFEGVMFLEPLALGGAVVTCFVGDLVGDYDKEKGVKGSVSMCQPVGACGVTGAGQD